jgi:hypothetical protein
MIYKKVISRSKAAFYPNRRAGVTGMALTVLPAATFRGILRQLVNPIAITDKYYRLELD